LSETQHARKKKAMIVHSYTGEGMEERRRKTGMASRVPMVPGAMGE